MIYIFKRNLFLIIFISIQILLNLSCKTTLKNANMDSEFKKNDHFYFEPNSWEKMCIKDKIEVGCWLTGSFDHVAVESKRIPILRGPSSTTETQFVITVSKNDDPLVYRIFDRKARSILVPYKVSEAQRDFSGFKNIHLLFNNLKPETEYEFLVASDSGAVVDERKFKTWPKKMKSVDFAVASCMDDFYLKQGGEQIWNEMLDWQPQALLLIGDNVYATKRDGKPIIPMSLKDLWGRYVDGRLSMPLFKRYILVPTYAVWDDHDYGAKDGDRDFELKDQSLKIFRDFYSHEPLLNTYENGPGAGSVFTIANQRFILADDRFFRTADARVKPGEDPQSVNSEQTHFGEQGENWIFKNLNASVKPTWLISGDQFFGAYHEFDSYEGVHPKSFVRFLALLRHVKSKVIFISGDRHLSEFMKIEKEILGYPTYEITSSGLHAKTYPGAWDKTKNPRFFRGESGVFNYTMIRSEIVGGKSLNMQVSSYKLNKELIYKELVNIPMFNSKK